VYFNVGHTDSKSIPDFKFEFEQKHKYQR